MSTRRAQSGFEVRLIWGLVSLCWVVAACGDDDNSSDAPPTYDPYADAPIVRLVHLAPSLGPVSAVLDGPSTTQVEPPEGGEPQPGPPVPRGITGTPLDLTAYTADFYYASAPTAHIEVTDADGTVVAERDLEVAAGTTYLAALVESAGAAGIETLALAPSPGDASDGQVRVGIFHAAEGLGRVDVALQGPGEAQWAGLTFGTTTLSSPNVLPPGTYALHLLAPGGDPIPAVAPAQLELQADTVVQIVLAPGASPAEWPRVVFLVDGAAEYPARIEPAP